MEMKLFILLQDIINNHKAGGDNDEKILELERRLYKLNYKPVIASDKTQRVYEYIQSHKKPVTSSILAHHFCLAQSTMAKHLRKLYEKGFINRDQQKGKIYWSLVAVPPELNKPIFQPTSKPTPVQVAAFPTSSFRKTSYPHVRGYDD